MRKVKSYRKYTEFGSEPAGLRRLDFVIENVQAFQRRNNKPSLRILDVGCGLGNISLPLGSLGYYVVGIDIDSQSIKEAKKRNIFPNVHFYVQDIFSFSPKRPFDIIIACEVIEHVENPLRLLKKIRQLLNLGGIVIVSIPNGFTWEERIRKFLAHNKLGRKIKKILKRTILKSSPVQSLAESPHLHFFSLKSIKNLFSRSGFKMSKIECQSAFFKECFYLGLRLFVSRGSKLFRFLDELDSKLADKIPLNLADGWMMVLKLKSRS